MGETAQQVLHGQFMGSRYIEVFISGETSDSAGAQSRTDGKTNTTACPARSAETDSGLNMDPGAFTDRNITYAGHTASMMPWILPPMDDSWMAAMGMASPLGPQGSEGTTGGACD